jgi:hypothetical protein
MGDEQKSPFDLVDQLATVAARSSNTIQKIKIPGGMVGKISGVLMITAIAVAAMVVSTRNIWVALVAIVLLLAVVLVLGLKLIDFANTNPQAALMEGAEFLLHEQITLGTKSHPVIPDNPANRTEPPPALPAPDNGIGTDPTDEK